MRIRMRAIVFLAAAGLLPLSCGKPAEEETPVASGSAGPPASVLAEIAAWRAVGGVVDLGDLRGKAPPPGAANAADLHRPLIDMFRDMPSSDRDLIGDQWDAPISRLKYVVESYEQELSTIKRAVAMPYCNWETNFDEGYMATLPHLAYSRNAARLLIADARVRASAGDFAGASDSIRSILLLGDQIAVEPVAIAVLVRCSLDVFAAEAIRRILKDQPEISTDLLDTMTQRNHRAYLRKAYQSEGAMMISMTVELAGGSPATPVASQVMSEPIAAGLVWQLQTLRAFVEQSALPRHKMTAAAEAPPEPSDARLPELHIDANLMERLSQTAASAENLTNQAAVALQVRDYRAKHGAYPDPSTFKLPIDVLTGEPMVYIRGADGFTLRVSQSPPIGGPTEQVWEW